MIWRHVQQAAATLVLGGAFAFGCVELTVGDISGGDASCAPGATEACYTGPGGTEGVGLCAAGTQTCNADGTGYGPCEGEVTPGEEACYTPDDESCHGEPNEGCVYASCRDLLYGNPGTPSGVAWIDPIGGGEELPVYCDMETEGGGWTMVFKITAGLEGDAYALWTGGPLNDAEEPLLHLEPSDRHYVSRIISRAWNTAEISFDEVRVNIYAGGELQKYFVFSAYAADELASSSNTLGWFARGRLLDASYEDIWTEEQNYFSLAGNAIPNEGDADWGRRFFINRRYDGCPGDEGWLVVDSAPDYCSLSWESGAPMEILYAPGETYANWEAEVTAGTVGRGEVLAVLVR